jgi:leucyl aminopeptidase
MATLSITARTAQSAELIKTQALAVLMPEKKTLSPALKALDKRLGGTVARSLQNGDFTGAAGSHLWLPGAGSVARILLVGCGDPGKLNTAQSKKISEALSRTLVASPAKDAQILMECLTQKLKNPTALMEQMSLSLSLAHYQYGQTLNKRKKPERALKKVRHSAWRPVRHGGGSSRSPRGCRDRRRRQFNPPTGQSARQHLHTQILGQRSEAARPRGQKSDRHHRR